MGAVRDRVAPAAFVASESGAAVRRDPGDQGLFLAPELEAALTEHDWVSAMKAVAGVDSSTQSTKVALRDLETGQLIATVTSPHPPTSPPVSEQDPGSWWTAMKNCFHELGDRRDDVCAISVAGQQHGLVVLDEAGQSIRPSKLWNDTTSAPQAASMVAQFGEPAWASVCGSVPVPSFTITKLAWIVENEPNIVSEVDKVMLPHDYLTWRLTGRHVTDRGDASGTGWFNPTLNRYEPDAFTHAGLDPAQWLSQLPTVCPHDQPVSEISPEAAHGLGLPPGVIIGPGTGDNMAAAIGLGLQPGDTAISLGTSGVVFATSDIPTHDATGTIAGFADATDRFLPLIATLNATKVTDAVARWLGTDPPGLSTLALQATESPDSPLLVPYFDGERTPNLPDATGVWTGLRTATTREQLALAAFDAVLCSLLTGFDALGEADIPTSGRTFLIGGGAKSAAFRARAAFLIGKGVQVPDEKELVTAGAATQAASILTGTSLQEIASAWDLGSGPVVEPGSDSGGEMHRERFRAARDDLMERSA